MFCLFTDNKKKVYNESFVLVVTSALHLCKYHLTTCRLIGWPIYDTSPAANCTINPAVVGIIITYAISNFQVKGGTYPADVY